MNKLQQIEEFQNDIIDNLFNGGTYGLAEAIYNAGYRKIPEDSVVLSSNGLKRLETNYKIGLGKSQSWCKSLKNRIEELEKENFKLEVDNEVLKEEKEQFVKDRETQAVKEFAEWIKDHIADVPFCNQKAYNVFCDMVNEKLKEYEK